MGDALWVRVLAKKMRQETQFALTFRTEDSTPRRLRCHVPLFRDPLTDGFGVNLTAAGLRQGTFAT